MNLAKIAIKRPTLIIVLFAMLSLGGILSYSKMGYELLPKYEPNVISVFTFYPGASPGEVEYTITKKIEDAVASMEGVTKIDSKSFEGVSVVIIALTENADVNFSMTETQRYINTVIKDFPDHIAPPALYKFSLSDLPIITAGATSNISDSEFYDLLDKVIQPTLSRVEGVAQVNLIGGREREIKVNLDPVKIQAYGLSVPYIQQAILRSNLDFPTGSIRNRESTTTIRLSGKYKDIDELRNLVIASQNNIQIRLSELADIEDAQKDATKLSRINQNEAILIQVVKQSNANAVSVSSLTHKAIAQIEKDYADYDIKITVVNDTSDFTLEAANSVMFDLSMAIVLVALVMLFFLHSFRDALIVMLTIPLSLIATFIGMYFMGYTLNLMTLLGLSLVVGVLVDDAIVVIENIHRHMEMGKNRVKAAYDGAREIGFTVTAITSVIVVVFIPVAMSSGLVSDIISQFCVTVSLATIFSLLASFTIVPWLSSRFGKIEPISGKNLYEKAILKFEAFLGKFTRITTETLKWCLGHKVATIATVSLIFFSSILLVYFGFIGSEFFPKTDKKEFIVELELPKDFSIEQTNFATQEAEAFLRQKKEVDYVITTVGQSNAGMVLGSSQSSNNMAEISVILVDKNLRKDDVFVYAAKTGKELQEVLVDAKVKTLPVGLLGAENAQLALIVMGATLDDAMDFAYEAKNALEGIQGATEVKMTVEDGSPEIEVLIERDKMAALGLDLQTVGLTMQTAFNGNSAGKFRDGEFEYDINIKFNELNRSNINDVRRLSFLNNQGMLIRLEQFASIKESTGPGFLERRDKAPSVMIRAQTIGRSTGAVASDWEAIFSKMDRPPGVEYVWTGDMEHLTNGFGSLGVSLVAALILVYLIMVALYNSFVYPFVILFSVPLALIGVLVALAATNNTLNIFTILGMIMLIGLVSKNAILLVDFANQRKEEGETTYNALIQANNARLRPILMTTIAMVFGMLPIALASGPAAELNNGLAWVVIGGLISSLFLTLVIVPIIYSIFDDLLVRYFKTEKVNYSALMQEDIQTTKKE